MCARQKEWQVLYIKGGKQGWSEERRDQRSGLVGHETLAETGCLLNRGVKWSGLHFIKLPPVAQDTGQREEQQTRGD